MGTIRTILIVDDEPSNLDLLEAILEISMKGVRLIKACDGEEAVTICEKEQDIDIILMDMKMPIMSGLDAAKIIKTFLDVPIVCMSAFEKDVLEKLENPFDFSIPKPIMDSNYLLIKIEEIYAKKQ